MKRMLFVFSIIICAVSLPYASTRSKINDGNKLYQKGDYDKALEKYGEAQISDPYNAVVPFNMGDADYKLEKFDEAASELNKAAGSKNKYIAANAYYNLGNAAVRQNKPDEAVKYYKKALTLNPDDQDAKYNLEYMLYQPKNKQKQNKQNDQNKKNNNKDKNQKNGKGDNDKNKQEREKQQQQKKGGMSKEDAERILNSYGEQDRNSAQKRKMAQPVIPKTDKDW